jgi:hypothetical protein
MKCRLKLKCEYDNVEFCTFCPPYQKALAEGKLKSRKYILSEKTKRKMSYSRIGIKYSDETKLRISQAKKGIKNSKEHCLAISKACRGKKHRYPNNRKSTCGRKPWSDEHKKMLSDILKNRKHKYPATRKKRVKNGSTQ